MIMQAIFVAYKSISYGRLSKKLRCQIFRTQNENSFEALAKLVQLALLEHKNGPNLVFGLKKTKNGLCRSVLYGQKLV